MGYFEDDVMGAYRRFRTTDFGEAVKFGVIS